MKTAFVIVFTLVMAVSGCQSTSPRGGSAFKDEGFKIAVPAIETKIKQGEVQTVTVSLHRGDYFKRDVTLEIKPSKGISVEPTKVVVEGSDKPDVQLRIAATKDSAIGEYFVYVKGTPESGEPTSVEFKVQVVAP